MDIFSFIGFLNIKKYGDDTRKFGNEFKTKDICFIIQMFESSRVFQFR